MRLLIALLLFASTACVPMGWWWTDPKGDHDNMGNQIDANEGEGEGEGEGEDGCAGVECPVGTTCTVDDNGNFVGCLDGGEGEGEGEPGQECRNHSDCVDTGVCQGPDDEPVCGIPPPEFEDECTQNADCVDGVCDFIDDGCGGSHLGCLRRCLVDDPNGCLADERCTEGRCEALTCQNDGFICPSHMICALNAPDPLTDDSENGCEKIPCEFDDECPFATPAPGGLVAILGFCVNGACASGAGQCTLPAP